MVKPLGTANAYSFAIAQVIGQIRVSAELDAGARMRAGRQNGTTFDLKEGGAGNKIRRWDLLCCLRNLSGMPRRGSVPKLRDDRPLKSTTIAVRWNAILPPGIFCFVKS